MFDTLELIQARVPQLQAIVPDKILGSGEGNTNDKEWQTRMSGKKLERHKLQFDPKVTQDFFGLAINKETQAIEVICLYMWGTPTLPSDDVIAALVGDKYTVAFARGGHGGYDFFLQPKPQEPHGSP